MKWIAICLLVLGLTHHSVYAKFMEDEPGVRLKAYIDSAHIEGPSRVRDQRYAGSLVFKAPIPFVYQPSVRRRISLGLDLTVDPDLVNKSGLVNIQQNFYTVGSFVEWNYVKVFRFSILAGPSLLITQNIFDIMNNKETRTILSYATKAGIAVDYAINSRWEVSWHLLTLYRHRYKKLDWRQGVGVGFNF